MGLMKVDVPPGKGVHCGSGHDDEFVFPDSGLVQGISSDHADHTDQHQNHREPTRLQTHEFIDPVDELEHFPHGISRPFRVLAPKFSHAEGKRVTFFDGFMPEKCLAGYWF
jgi:hypothetical protein